jgi:hypothetical protein
MQSIFDKPNRKLFLYVFLWTIAGIVLAFFWGLGWFFLMMTIRRMVTYIPPLNRKLREFIYGPGLEAESIKVSPPLRAASQIMAWIITVIWIGLTIFVFIKINIPLITIFVSIFNTK